MVSKVEQKYQDYFLSAKTETCLHKDGVHAEFRTFEEHDLTDYWGFFKLPETDELITSPGDISCQYCGGDGIYSLSSLLDFSLDAVFESLPKEEEAPFRLGFFKLFPNRKVHRPYDAYLHHVSGGGRMNLSITDAKPVLASKDLFQSLLRELCRLFSTDFNWSENFVGIVISLPVKDNLSIQIWTSPDMKVMDVRRLMLKLESVTFCSSCSECPEGLKFVVEDPLDVEADDTQVNEIRAMFLAEPTDKQTVVPKPLKADWLVLASSYPQGLNGSFVDVRPVSQLSSIVKTDVELDRIFEQKLKTFPGILAQNSYTILYQRSTLPASPTFTIKHLPELHNPFVLEISDMPSYTAYIDAFRLVAQFVATSDHPVDALFAHFQPNEQNPTPKASKFVFEFWGKKHMNRNLQNAFKSALHIYLRDNI